MEECVCPLKLPKQNRDCRQTKLMLPPPLPTHSPPTIKKKKHTVQNWIAAIQTALLKVITPLPII